MKIQRNRVLHYRFTAIAGLLLALLPWRLSAAEETDAAAVFTLASVDGRTVPAIIAHGGATVEIRSGRFILNADGTCNSRMVFSVGSRPEALREVNATYTREGSKLTMQWKGAGQTTGVLDGSTFTMKNEGLVYVYRRK